MSDRHVLKENGNTISFVTTLLGEGGGGGGQTEREMSNLDPNKNGGFNLLESSQKTRGRKNEGMKNTKRHS
jgi:hypothetical protein